MANIGWGDVKTKSDSPKNYTKGAGNSDLFVKLPVGEHEIRLVGEPHEIYIAWIKNPETGANDKFIVPQKGGYIQRLKALGVEVKKNYATNCFVISDDKVRLRILEKGPSIFDSFSNWYHHFTYPKGHKKEGQKINPGGVDGPKFLISALDPPGKNSNQRINYSVIALQQTPFTKEQIEVLKREKIDAEKYADLPLGERGKIDLAKYYDEERAEEKLKNMHLELAGISKVDGNSDTEDAPISGSDDESDSPAGSDDIGDLIGEDSSSDDSQEVSENENEDEDSKLLKQAEEVLGDLF
jgi:hypothetical protein